MPNGLQAADYIVVGGFFVVMLGIGAYFAKSMRSLKDFFCGGNRVPWWVSGVSLYMTTFSAFTFVSYSALAYNEGLVCITIWWLTVPCAIIGARYFASRWRRIDATSPVEFIEHRYGPALRQGFSWAGVPLIVFDDALKLYVIGTMVTVSFGIENEYAMPAAIAVCGTIMLAYTLMGGLWAVMITDFVQFIIMGTAVLVMTPLVLSKAGGFGAIIEQAPPGFWRLTSDNFSVSWLIPFSLVMFLSYTTRWSIVQRYYSVGTDADARKVGYTLGILTFIGVPLLFLPAYAARVFLPGIEDANTVYPLVCRAVLPVGLFGMVIAGMFSATMSMLSSDYNAVASVVTNDIYKRLFAPKASERSLVLIGRLSTLGIGMAAVVIAVILSQAKELEDLVGIMAKVFSLLLPPIGIPMVFGLLTRRVSEKGALAGFVTGAACGAVAYTMSYLGDYEYLRSVPYLTWITGVPTLSLMLFLSFLFPDSTEKRAAVVQFLAGVSGETSIEHEKAEPKPGGTSDTKVAIGIIGLATAAIGGLLLVSVLLTVDARDATLSITVGALLLIAGLAARNLVR